MTTTGHQRMGSVDLRDRLYVGKRRGRRRIVCKRNVLVVEFEPWQSKLKICLRGDWRWWIGESRDLREVCSVKDADMKALNSVVIISSDREGITVDLLRNSSPCCEAGFDVWEVSTSEAKYQVKRRFPLNVVISTRKGLDMIGSYNTQQNLTRQCTAILELLTCKDESLLIRGYPFHVLNLCFDVLDSVRRLAI